MDRYSTLALSENRCSFVLGVARGHLAHIGFVFRVTKIECSLDKLLGPVKKSQQLPTPLVNTPHNRHTNKAVSAKPFHRAQH